MTKDRSCLKCGRKFDSDGPANRICERCCKQNAKIVGREAVPVRVGRKQHDACG